MGRDFLKDFKSKPKGVGDMPDRAQEVLNFFCANDFSSGVPIVEILTKLGFKIFQSDLEPDDLSAYIAVDPKFEDLFGANKIICVNVRDNLGHKTFALAHELAHYLFDFDESKDLYYYNTYFRRNYEGKMEEDRANKFAANLLMPENIFRNEFEKLKDLQSKIDIVSELGRFFRVSPTAILRRFDEIGINEFVNNTRI